MKRLQIQPPTGIEFTAGQLVATSRLELVTRLGGVLVLSGVAGSGKSILLASVAQALEDSGIAYTVVCPTGRAAARLRAAGVREAQTIHSWMYRPLIDKVGNLTGFKRKTVEDLPPHFVLLLDEASMVGPTVLDDLLEVVMPDPDSGRALIFVGDGFQLPPILTRGEEELVGKDFSIFSPVLIEAMAADHCDLTEIVRQAADSPIIGLATAIRTEARPAMPDCQAIMVLRQGRRAIEQRLWARASDPADETITLTWTNKDRRFLNAVAREARGFGARPVEAGEKLVVVANHKETALCNGDLIQAREVAEPLDTAVGRIYPLAYDGPWGPEECGMILHYDGLDGEGRTAFARAAQAEKLGLGRPLICDYGYALTCHKAQGCEYTSVEVYAPDSILEVLGEAMARRWLYTAVTRAKGRFLFSGGSNCAFMLGG